MNIPFRCFNEVIKVDIRCIQNLFNNLVLISKLSGWALCQIPLWLLRNKKRSFYICIFPLCTCLVETPQNLKYIWYDCIHVQVCYSSLQSYQFASIVNMLCQRDAALLKNCFQCEDTKESSEKKFHQPTKVNNCRENKQAFCLFRFSS